MKEGKGGERMVHLPIWALCKGEKKSIFLFGGLFARGLLKRVEVVFKKPKILQILKNVWFFPIAYCDAIKPWQLGFQNIITYMMQGKFECAWIYHHVC